MILSYAQRILFRQQGYLVVPRLVSLAQAAHARRAINMSLGQGIDPDNLPRLRVQSFCPELRTEPALMALLQNPGVTGAVGSLLGPGMTCPGSQGDAQINLRFPVVDGPPSPLIPHLDGMSAPSNFVPNGELRSFTALIGVMLNDIPTPDCGNFVVWPGSHLANASYLKEHGSHTLLERMPAVLLSEPRQICGATGDVVIAHYLLSHGTARNLGPDVRYMVFFRLVHVNHDTQKWDALAAPWMHWPGIRSLEDP